MNKEIVRYSWVETHKELVRFLAKKKNNHKLLIDLLKKVGITGFKDKDTEGDTSLDDIDPFTFFCYIYKYGSKKRLEYLQKIAEEIKILPIPTDESGIPSADPRKVCLFPFKPQRNDEISRLWKFFFSALKERVTNEEFEDVLKIKGTGKTKLTEVLFYINPEKYFPINSAAKPYLKEKLEIEPEFNTYSEYLDLLKKISEKTDMPFYELSYESWKWTSKRRKINYWVFQGNPEIWHVIDAISQNALSTWSVKAHKKEIRSGDKVIIWVTGKRPGCYALCEVTSDVFEDFDDDNEMKYYAGKLANEKATRVRIKMTHNLSTNPITRSRIKEIDELSALKVGQQGTIFLQQKMNI